ncbi:MAG: hypothetical protein ACXVHQ_20745 [Solirubrobacteraceae bacterium]
MTTAVCSPSPPSIPIFERERRADRFVELLECLDLRVATARQRMEITESIGLDPAPQVRAAAQRLIEVERSLSAMSAEAASVHQALRHMQLI